MSEPNSSWKETAAAEWKRRSEKFKSTNPKELEAPLRELDYHLNINSFILWTGNPAPEATAFVVRDTISETDMIVWREIRANKVAYSFIKQGSMPNIVRWLEFVDSVAGKAATIMTGRTKAEAGGEAKVKAKAKADAGASYEIGLENTDNGVVTRFPPEPSGYLHIGHAKAALLNDYFAHKRYNGKMIVRFDDTNPSKEKQEYQDAILLDCELLGVKPDQVTYTSDYFEDLYKIAVQMITDGNAYADNTPQEQLREERSARIESSHRNDSVEDNLKHFELMKEGSDEGRKWYIRAKIDMSSNNGAMRDPVIYRCNVDQPHHRTGTAWKIYPTYDFACPVVDSVEGITHALRTTEYNDRDPQYQWFLKTLGLRHVYNWNFSRMNFIKTFLSKRKLTKVVDDGKVWGWDDPRMPTVRGIRRRGMTIPALQEYIIRQGPSKNINLQDWTTFWATNKKHIDPIAKRYTAIETTDKVVCTVTGAPETPRSEEKPVHAKNADLGTKKVVYSKNIILDQADARSFDPDEEITLMNWGNAIVRVKHYTLNPLNLTRSEHDKTVSELQLELHLQGDPKKTSKKVTWLSTDQELIPLTMYDFDYLIKKDKLEEDDKLEDCLNRVTETKTEVLADCNVAALKEDDIVQFDRKGFFRIDRAFKHGESVLAFQIPTGKKM